MLSTAAFPLTEIGIVLLVAIMASILMRSLKQNQVLGYMLAGMILGPLGMGYLTPNEGLAALFGELGLFVLMFYLGIELSFKKFVEAGPSAFILAFAEMVSLTIGGGLLVTLFGFSPFFALIVGVMIFCHSTPVVAKVILDFKLSDTKVASIAHAILVLEDLLAVLLVVFLTSFSASGNALSVSLTAVVFTVAMYSIVRRLSKVVEAYIIQHGYGHEETTLFALGVGLAVCGVASILNISIVIGAHFAGFAISDTQAGQKIKKDLGFLRDFFLLFFFVSFGTTLFYDAGLGMPVLPAISDLVALVGIALCLTVLLIVANFFVFGFIGKRIGLSSDEASLAATLLVPLGEFLVIIATTAIPVLSGTEAAMIAPLAFILILVTVSVFQPLYNNRHHHRRAMEIFPQNSLVQSRNVPQKHTDETFSRLKRIMINTFTILCIAGLMFFLYEAVPQESIPFNFAREIFFFAMFAICSAFPANVIIKSIKYIYRHQKGLAMRGQFDITKFRL
ncbi:MAG: cation:proton antiporter [Candidatus Micrarchaeia archaeon]